MELSAKVFARVLAWLICIFFTAHVFFGVVEAATGRDYVFGLVPLFDLRSEQSLSTWYSTLALAFSALLLLVIYRAKSASGDPLSRHWLGLAAIFLFLSADEAALIHEKVSLLIREYVSTFGLELGQWTLVYAVLLVAFLLVYWPFVRSLWPRPGMSFVVAGATFVTGALVLELVSLRVDDLVYHLVAGLEEVFEMLGILLWMRALLVYMSDESISLNIRPKRSVPARF